MVEEKKRHLALVIDPERLVFERIGNSFPAMIHTARKDPFMVRRWIVSKVSEGGCPYTASSEGMWVLGLIAGVLYAKEAHRIGTPINEVLNTIEMTYTRLAGHRPKDFIGDNRIHGRAPIT